MRRIIKFLPLVLAVACSSSQFDSSSSDYASSEDRLWNYYDREDQPRVLKVYLKQRELKRIQGLCVLKNDQDIFDNYCNNIELALEDKSGKVISTTRTEPSGAFIFHNIPQGSYLLKVVDSRYQKSSDLTFVSPGAEVLINLEMKK